MLRATLSAAACLCVATLAVAQSAPVGPPPATQQQNNSIEDVSAQILELRQALASMREELAGSRRESGELRQELQAVRGEMESLQRMARQAAGPPAAEPSSPSPDRVDALAEEQELIRAKVEDQEQSKVDSGSKHHVRLSGLVLLNVSAVAGAVDNLDLPEVAESRLPGDSGGSLSAGARQSRLGVEVFGPTIGGARTTGALAFDFFGGFPGTGDGVSAPRVRFRTATFTLDWKKTSVMAGQDVPFFSPRSPSSLASAAYPALSAAGNLWAWTMQLHVDHRVGLPGDSTMVIQWGLLDPLTGESPASEYDRVATAGERSRQPAQAIRVGWQRGADARVVAVGAGAYHARQNWGFGRTVDAWTATTDWDVALGRRFALSGELYRGRALAGLGGGASDSVLFDGAPTDAASIVRPVTTIGGGSQLKFKPAPRLEFNAAFGEDNPTRTGMSRLFSIGGGDGSAVNRNGSGLLNTIYQARSNLLFSIEYRRLWTTGLDDVTRTADHVSLTAGVAF